MVLLQQRMYKVCILFSIISVYELIKEKLVDRKMKYKFKNLESTNNKNQENALNNISASKLDMTKTDMSDITLNTFHPKQEEF